VFRSHNAPAVPLAAESHADTTVADTFPLDVRDEEAAALIQQVSKAALAVMAEMEFSPAASTTGLDEFLQDPAVRRPPPERGGSLAPLLETIGAAGRFGLNTHNGRMLAFIPGSGLVSSAATDLLAGVINSFTGATSAAPAMMALERDVVGWMADVMGLPAAAGGILSSGGSMSTLSALLCARSARLSGSLDSACLYVTAETHHCAAKAALLLGFPKRAVRIVPVDGLLRMDIGALRHMVAADRAEGRAPFCIVANAGATSTGAIDPLPELAVAARELGLWLHIDAAYGGFFQLTSRGRAALAGIEDADSIVLDPHKSLFLPFGTGCLLVRDEAALRRAHSVESGAYLRDLDDTGDDFADISPELTRPNRGLRLWLPLHLHGVAAFRDALDEKLDLTEELAARLRATPGIEVHPGSSLSVIAFRRNDAGNDEEQDRATEEIVRQINRTGEIYIATTRVQERVYARIALLSLRTNREHAERLFALLTSALESNSAWEARHAQ